MEDYEEICGECGRAWRDDPEANHCSNCGACHDGVEIEWCEMGEHCDQCCDCEGEED